MKALTRTLLGVILFLAPLAAVAVPAIEIVKEASADGLNFFDANAAGDSDVPVVSIGSQAFYRITVTNIGDVILLNAVVQDDLLGISSNLGNLAVDMSVVLELSLEITEDLDLIPPNTLENFAEVLAQFPDMPADVGGVSDIDPAHIQVVPASVPEPMSLALMSVGLAGIGYRWRKQIKAA